MFETKDMAPKIDDSGIDVADNMSLWVDWEPTNAKASRVQKDEKQVERENTAKIQDELIDVLQSQTANAKQL